jgi:hypothetical protein
MSYEMKGTVKVIMDLQEFDSGFTKREFVITTDAKYPQDVKFETVRERTNICAAIKVGQVVNVSFDVRGNEYKDRFYVNLNCWKAVVIDAEKSTQSDKPEYTTDDPPADDTAPSGSKSVESETEDYPF